MFVNMESTVRINPSKLMTIDEYADYRKVSRQTVYNWIKEGYAKEVRIRGKRFIDKTTGKPF